MFVKIIPSSGWDFGEAHSQLIKAGSRGLIGNDFRSFVKRAGYQFAEQMKKMAQVLKPGDVPVHDLIVGATEFFGPNRNGDGFKEANCRKYHDTFVKHAHCYREHDNKDPKKSYGYVKFSGFNESMKRIELLSIYNGTKEAADRNGGLVADEEVQLLESGKDFPISMACKIAFDVCSSCGNQAKNRSEYCRGVNEGGFCKGGGLTNKIATVIEDHEWPILHADNPDPCFFDRSKVARGAERTAWAMGFDKAASADAIVGGARLAEFLGVTAPRDLLATGITAELYKIACTLAVIENKMASTNRLQLAFDSSVQPALTWDDGGTMGDALKALANEKIAMPVAGFISLIRKDLDHKKVATLVQEHLPGIYSRMIRNGEMSQLIESNPFVPSGRLPSSRARDWAEKRSSYSLASQCVEDRIMRAVIRTNGEVPNLRCETHTKVATSQSIAAEEIAKRYAVYKLAAIHSMAKGGPIDDLAELIVVQNYLPN